MGTVVKRKTFEKHLNNKIICDTCLKLVIKVQRRLCLIQLVFIVHAGFSGRFFVCLIHLTTYRIHKAFAARFLKLVWHSSTLY